MDCFLRRASVWPRRYGSRIHATDCLSGACCTFRPASLRARCASPLITRPRRSSNERCCSRRCEASGDRGCAVGTSRSGATGRRSRSWCRSGTAKLGTAAEAGPSHQDIKVLSLPTFFAPAKKVGCRRATPGRPRVSSRRRSEPGEQAAQEGNENPSPDAVASNLRPQAAFSAAEAKLASKLLRASTSACEAESCGKAANVSTKLALM